MRISLPWYAIQYRQSCVQGGKGLLEWNEFAVVIRVLSCYVVGNESFQLQLAVWKVAARLFSNKLSFRMNMIKYNFCICTWSIILKNLLVIYHSEKMERYHKLQYNRIASDKIFPVLWFIIYLFFFLCIISSFVFSTSAVMFAQSFQKIWKLLALSRNSRNYMHLGNIYLLFT